LWYSIVGRPNEAYCLTNGRFSAFKGLPSGSQVCYQDRLGFLWLIDGQRHVGLWKDGQLMRLAGLSIPSVFRALNDREGGFWIATDDEALYHLRPQLITVHGYRGRPEKNYLHALLSDRSGNVWSATSDGVSLFRNGRFEKFYLLAEPAPEDLTLSLFEDRDGTL
jgi:ligand-binding sensor domain-containing protein